MLRSSLVISTVTLLLSVACAAPQTVTPAVGTAATSEETGTVDVKTTDGVNIRGHIYGKGESVVVLAHMFPADQRSWMDFAKVLAAKGYRAITFDFRGYGESSGEKDIPMIYKDEYAVLDFMSNQGAKKVFLVGASMGGTASLKVASSTDVAGVATLSTPSSFRGLSVEEELGKVTEPKLFIACEGDSNAAQSLRLFQERSPEPKKGVVLQNCAAHGTDMLKGDTGERVQGLLLDFLERNSKP